MDGNCLFHALVDQLRQLHMGRYRHLQLRQLVCDYLHKNPSVVCFHYWQHWTCTWSYFSLSLLCIQIGWWYWWETMPWTVSLNRWVMGEVSEENAQKKEWGGHIELMGAANLLRVAICVITDQPEKGWSVMFWLGLTASLSITTAWKVHGFGL